MSDICVKKIRNYDRVLRCPPDKSISVRAVILCSYANGCSTVKNISHCDDVMSAAECMRKLGAKIEFTGRDAHITGAPFKPAKLYCGNSAATARLLLGLLSGLSGKFELDGDESLRNRPMSRVIEPLRVMGAEIYDCDGRLPVTVIGSRLNGLRYYSPVPSAQVKSALLLSALNGSATVSVTERIKTRDHTERMLTGMNGALSVSDNTVTLAPSVLFGRYIDVPGDLSSALYPICLALATGGKCVVRGVGLNPTRTGAIELLKSIGANIEVSNAHDGDEPRGDITVSGGELRPFEIGGDDVARMIDEVPSLAALACFINGKSVISGADELRHKESDRIKATVATLASLGADISETADGIVVRGGKSLRYGTVDSCGDHRIAMAAAVAAAAGEGGVIRGGNCVSVSYPDFFEEVLDV